MVASKRVLFPRGLRRRAGAAGSFCSLRVRRLTDLEHWLKQGRSVKKMNSTKNDVSGVTRLGRVAPGRLLGKL